MRYLRIVLTLVFGLAMAGPEAHACPIHSAGPVHHQQSSDHHKSVHCTCPQACCPAGVSVSLPMQVADWTAAPLPVVAVDLDVAHPRIFPSREHLFPFALAPPRL